MANCRFFLFLNTCIVFAKQLHAHDGEYEDYNTQDEGQIA